MSILGDFAVPVLPSAPQDQPLRICLLSTPRSGNNWLRLLFRQLLDIPAVSVHSPVHINWEDLPQKVLIGLHWHPTSAFVEQLEAFGFHVVVLVRHPLDVLISILHFAFHYSAGDETQRWLEGEDGNERPIFAAMPRSTAFLDYATSRRVEALLAVGQEWWRYPGCHQVRYENLLRRPEETLNQLVGQLGARLSKPIPEALAATTIDRLRKMTGVKGHFWQGKEGLWRSLLPAAEATRIAEAHAAVFADLGYVCDPDPGLDGAQADANWVRLMWAELAEEVSHMKSRHTTAKMLRDSQEQLLTSRANHNDLLQKWEQSQRTLAELQAQLVQSREELKTSQEETRASKEAVGALREELASLESQSALAKDALNTLQSRYEGVLTHVEALHKRLSESEQVRTALATEIETVRPRLVEVAELGARAIRVARNLSRVSRRYPQFASLVKLMVGGGKLPASRKQPRG